MSDGVYSLVTDTKRVLAGERERGKSKRQGGLRAGGWERAGSSQLPPRSPFLLCVWSPSGDVKVSTLPACVFSRRQPDLSPGSAQPQLLVFSRFSLPITGMVAGHGSHWPTEQLQTQGDGWEMKRIQKERRTTKLTNVCLNVYKILL